MKTCNKCASQKPLTGFSKDKSKSDGLCTICKDCRVSYRKLYYEANREKACAYSLEWYEANKEKAAVMAKAYRENNKDRQRELRKEKYWSDPESAKDYNKEYIRERCRVDPLFRIIQRCRKRIWAAIKENGYTKKSKSFEIIGCTAEELASHLASKFTEGMTLDNYGSWHIDHIVPVSSAKTEQEVISLCHYSNLQPLWAEDNLKKSARIDYCNH